jgi:hypothetical protein
MRFLRAHTEIYSQMASGRPLISNPELVEIYNLSCIWSDVKDEWKVIYLTSPHTIFPWTTKIGINEYKWVRVMVFNATFNNISDISWRSVLLVEETGVPGENHRPVASHWQTLLLKVNSQYTVLKINNIKNNKIHNISIKK